MKTKNIQTLELSELDDYAKFVKLEHELQFRLQDIAELQKLVHDKLKMVTSTCAVLRMLQSKCKFKTSKELQARIKKEAGY